VTIISGSFSSQLCIVDPNKNLNDKIMKKQTLKNSLKGGILALTVALATITGTVTEATDQAVKNVVLVHGAFADGSGYRAL
jgi:hypothetical protein